MKIIFIIIILVFLYYQHKSINKISENIEILQANNPEKNKFEEILMEKNPAVFTNILNDINLTKKNIKSYFYYYLPPFYLNYNFELLLNKKDSETKLVLQTSFRYIIYQMKGIKKIILFNPKEIKFLYPNYKNNESNVNFWNYDSNVYPDFNKSSYLEVILHPRQMIYIPHKWWFTSKTLTTSNSLICESDTIFSKILKKQKN